MTSHVVAEEPTGAVAPADEVVTHERPEDVPEKFWNAETGEVNHDAVLKSYNELESKNSQTNDEDGNAEDTSENDDVVDDTSEGESELTGLDAVLESKGIVRSELTAELTEDGTLSEGSYAKLAEAGYDQQTVDAFIEGNKAQYAQVANDINEVKSSVENFDAMADWVANTFTDDQLKSYNDMVTSGDKSQAQAAVNWAHGLFSEALGDDVNLLGGNEPVVQGEVFRSNAEVTKAMSDPRYKKDSAYREDVAKKLQRSKVL